MQQEDSTLQALLSELAFSNMYPISYTRVVFKNATFLWTQTELLIGKAEHFWPGNENLLPFSSCSLSPDKLFKTILPLISYTVAR